MELLGGLRLIRNKKAKVDLSVGMNAEVAEILPGHSLSLSLGFLSGLVQVFQHLQVPEQKAVKYHSGIGKEVVKPN